MQTITISRNDDVYEAFADIACAGDGTLVCTYRESLCHGPWPFSRIIVRRSLDAGLTWGPRQLIIERNETRTAAGEGRLNCSRILARADGTLLLIVDLLIPTIFEDFLKPGVCRNLLFRSGDGGVTWEGPQDTGVTEGIVPSLKELVSGRLLLGVTEQWPGTRAEDPFIEQQTVYVSDDGGRHWDGPSIVPSPATPTVTGLPWRLNEGDFVELDDGTIVLYMREDGERLSAFKSLSTDGGRSWSAAVRTPMPNCVGRPSAGRLRSGEIAVTYRLAVGLSTSLALYVETPVSAVGGPTQQDSPMARFTVLDNDRSVAADSGYSGWVQMADGDLYVVNYVTDDAPRAFIRGYRVGREDWYLFPPGDIVANPPGARDGSYYELGQALAREQQAHERLARGDGRDDRRTVPTSK
ncbi:MAG: sialidase family protein [bacterium]|nr:sialidase family protein [bacterium]